MSREYWRCCGIWLFLLCNLSRHWKRCRLIWFGKRRTQSWRSSNFWCLQWSSKLWRPCLGSQICLSLAHGVSKGQSVCSSQLSRRFCFLPIIVEFLRPKTTGWIGQDRFWACIQFANETLAFSLKEHFLRLYLLFAQWQVKLKCSL